MRRMTTIALASLVAVLAPVAATTAPAKVQRGAVRAVRAEASAVARPPVVVKHIPFGAKRKREMAAYARRHYGIDDYRLTRPRVIVEHYTVNDSVQATFHTFAPDVADRSSSLCR